MIKLICTLQNVPKQFQDLLHTEPIPINVNNPVEISEHVKT